MTRYLLGSVGAAAVVLAAGGPAGAQPPVPGGAARPTNRPVFSPYLNLLRPNSSPALNYFGLVRPEIQARRAIQNLAEEVDANRDAISTVELGESDLPATGLATSFLNLGGPVSFLNTGGYFRGSGPVNTGNIRRGVIRPVNQLTNPVGPSNSGVIGGGQMVPRQ